MLVVHPFDIALILRTRRCMLRIRQADLAKRAGVSRGLVVDLEHGKETIELGKLMKVLAALDVPLDLKWDNDPPAWAKARLKRVQEKEKGWAALRPRSFIPKPRPVPAAPQSWHDEAERRLAALEERERAERGGHRGAPTPSW